MKYTKEVLEPIVKSSFSVAEVTRKLGLKNPNGGTQQHISRKIRKFEIDTRHFLGQSRNMGLTHRGGSAKLSWDERLVKHRTGRKEKTKALREAMIDSGISHICGTCATAPMWNGRPLVLQISHKDGDSLNNERTNLHFECPNCHSQTSDYAGKGHQKNKPSVVGTADTNDSKSFALVA